MLGVPGVTKEGGWEEERKREDMVEGCLTLLLNAEHAHFCAWSFPDMTVSSSSAASLAGLRTSALRTHSTTSSIVPSPASWSAAYTHTMTQSTHTVYPYIQVYTRVHLDLEDGQ